jgi:hypothetical protein
VVEGNFGTKIRKKQEEGNNYITGRGVIKSGMTIIGGILREYGDTRNANKGKT